MEDNRFQTDPNRVYIDEQVNRLRHEHLDVRERSLDHRSRSVSWWLSAMGAAFALATVVLAVLTSLGTQESRKLRTDAEGLIQDLKKEVDLSLVKAIEDGEYTPVSIDSFISTVVASKQVTETEITQFIKDARSIFADRQNRDDYAKGFVAGQFNRWSIDVDSVGKVLISGIRNKGEFVAAWDGMVEVLDALKGDKKLPGAKFLVRGMDRIFYVGGITGVSSRAGIAFDLR